MDQETFTLGEHNALLRKLDEGQTAIFGRLGTIEQTLAEQRGERRVASAMWGGGAGILASTVAFLTKTYLFAHK